MDTPTEAQTSTKRPGTWRFFAYSAIGIVMFFVPVTIAGTSTIPLDHIVTAIRTFAGPVVPFIVLALILLGAVRPFVTGTWKSSVTKGIFAVLGVVGLVVAILILTAPPAWLAAEDIGPFLWDKLVIPVGLIVPVGAIFLALLVGYGLMEFIGVLVQPIMRPVFKTPGRSAIDAVASFVGSYSLGLLITNRVYKEGKYTAREAAIIATGFSTVSATFMIVVAKTLDLMDHWLLYFFFTLVVTFVVTAITVHLPPLRRIPDTYYPGATPQPEEKVTKHRFRIAWREAKATLAETPSLGRNLWINFRDGLLMASSILPSILSVGLIGLLLAKYTPIFDWLGWIFVPFTWVTQLSDPILAGKASALGLVEMFLPATQVAGSDDLVLRFVIAVVSVAGIIFFSAMVPSILATEIPISVGALVIIWFERVVLTILISAPLAHLLL
ncbi:YjiH family protein [Brevibacterium casei]|uniref:Nucleoside recognition GATE domain-containing membrane protein YjiH n=2 Tax=Bacteria TaxID=2 RepID=A0A2H1JEZ6_9MICO|nr:YjiH family protein [Brevibacterium casei]QPR39066.1 YjiH family protein [Brevibacterium casei]QPR43232.1 YjiH family protein [Brevibacterium casei]SMX86065.1 nucleoside recognition GATE domain-containing membrane protein YjiH [Brevibacterium casei CIP 102111]